MRHDNGSARKLPERAIWQKMICPECGKQFTINRQISRRQKYCSLKCAQAVAVRNYRKKHICKYKHKNINICPRCGQEFVAHKCAKYCPDCLRWLALNSSAASERAAYAQQFNIRKDCQNKGLIELRKINRAGYIVFGKRYYSKSEICKAFHIARWQLDYRLNQGMTAENAVKKIIKEKNK